MDITNSSESRVNAGVEILLEGHPISCDQVTFRIENKILSVTSFTSSIHLENVTQTEAKEKIERSKLVGAKLAELNPSFSKVWNGLKHEYYFGFDYGKGGFEIAEEIDNQFKWKK